MKKLIAYILSVVIVMIAGWLLFREELPALALDKFAQCLKDQGAIMYGAVWCPHCQNQKKLFGSSFRIIPYVECPDDPQKCLEEGIKGYPTWIFGDGVRLGGEQSLEKLSEVSSCPLKGGE